MWPLVSTDETAAEVIVTGVPSCGSTFGDAGHGERDLTGRAPASG